MNKFTSRICGDTIVFELDALAYGERQYDFRLYIGDNKVCVFKVIGAPGAGEPVRIPSVVETLLGEPYQDVERLGYEYGAIPWYANIIHELVHVWYCATRYNVLSPNHAMLMSMGDAPIELCDQEEIIVTGFQVYANTGKISYRSFELLSPDDAERWRYFNAARDFINWVIDQLQ